MTSDAGQVIEAATQQLQVGIRERNEIEEALRASEVRYHDLYDNAPDMFVSVDPETAAIKECNQTLATALGYTNEEIVGRPIFGLYHPDCMEDVQKAFRSFVETGEVRNAELQVKRKDGSKIDVLLNASAVRDKQGNILYSRSTLRDITECKKAEQALGESEQLLRHIAEAVREVFFIVDHKNCSVLYVNPAYEKIWGRTCESLYQEPTSWLDAIFSEDRERVNAALEEQGRTGEFNEEFRITRPSGSIRWIHDRVFPIRDPKGEVYRLVGIAEDITERKKAEEEQALINAELERFNRLAVGREERMITLKREVSELLQEAGKPVVYDLSFVPQATTPPDEQ